MTERKSLPDSLAPDVRHLVVELRVMTDRGGLSLAALAHRTPYSKSSWERYLNGKALPPQHAVTSLGKLADADPARLTALWELANTAWHEADTQGELQDGPRDEPQDNDTARRDRQPAAPPPAAEPASAAQAEQPDAEHPNPEQPEPEPPATRGFGNRPLMWWATAASLAAVVVSAVALFGAFGRDSGRHGDRNGASATDTPARQIDVTCFAESCEGKDPKEAGCGDVWTSAKVRIGRVYVELRYSDACKAAWSRISWGRPGDTALVVAADGHSYERKVRYDTDTFSNMVATSSPTTARACVVMTSGVHGCTGWGSTHHLTDAPNPPAWMLTPTASPSATAPNKGQAG